MKLSNEGLRSPEWKEKGYKLFDYDRNRVVEATHKEPVWVHFGAGNIFRGFPARLDQILIEKGLTDKGIIVGEGFECRFPCDQTEGDFSYTVTVSNSSHSFSVWEESS